MSGDDARPARGASLELMQLDNGDVVLRRAQPDAGGDAAPDTLVSVRFSREMLEVAGDDVLEVVEAMLDAAADALAELREDAASDETLELNGWELIRSSASPVLH